MQDRDYEFRRRRVTEEQVRAIEEFWNGYDIEIKIEPYRDRRLSTKIFCIRSDIGKRMKL